MCFNSRVNMQQELTFHKYAIQSLHWAWFPCSTRQLREHTAPALQTQRLMYSLLTRAHSPPHTHTRALFTYYNIHTYASFVDVCKYVYVCGCAYTFKTHGTYRYVQRCKQSYFIYFLTYTYTHYTYSILTNTSRRNCTGKTLEGMIWLFLMQDIVELCNITAGNTTGFGHSGNEIHICRFTQTHM